jgi:hypothetical protein
VTTPRTVRTIDHGTVTVVCPPWCTGGHEDGGHRADIHHSGPDIVLAFHGAELFTACLVQSPYATPTNPELGGPTTGVSVYPLALTLDPVQLYDLAASLDGYADQLRDLADQLTTLLGGEGR